MLGIFISKVRYMISYMLSLMAVMSEGLGFNLCVTPFPNVYVPNFKLEDLCQCCSEWSECKISYILL